MRDSVIIDGLRSPIGINKGNLRGIRPDDLSSNVLKKLLSKNNNIEPSIYEDLVMGQVLIILLLLRQILVWRVPRQVSISQRFVSTNALKTK